MITEEQIRREIREPEALDAARRAFRALASGAVRQPSAISLELPEWSGDLRVTAAHIRGSPIFAVKMDTGYQFNHERGLPNGAGLMVVFDAATGRPLETLLDGGYLTELRTGGAGALAADLLAPECIETVGTIGTGRQARFQLRALAGVRRWGDTFAWSPDPEETDVFCNEMSEELGIRCHAVSSPEAVALSAQVIYTVTPSRSPLVEADWLAPGATVIAVGADAAGKQELDIEVLRRADKVVADDWSQAMRIGELRHAIAAGLPLSQVHGELGKVVTGERSGREGDEVIVCDLTGLGAQDTAIAEIVWDRLGG